MTKELRLRQTLSEGTAVDRQKWLSAAGAVMMQIARHHLFAGAGLTNDQHRRVGRRKLIQHAFKGARCGVNQLRAGNLHLIYRVNWKAMTIPRG